MLDSNNTQMNDLMINEFPFLLVRHTYARNLPTPTCSEWMDGWKNGMAFLVGMSLVC
jgi:hypothetical protein